MIVTVKPGDTLSEICERVLGRASAWREVARKNRLRNPHLIFPGQKIAL